jgi:endoglucanase
MAHHAAPWLLAFLLGATFAWSAEPDAAARRFRGFTVGRMDREVLNDVKTRWNANMVRYMMCPVDRAKWTRSTPAATWRALLQKLPQELDAAAELGIAVVLDLHQIPNDRATGYPGGREFWAAFWDDATNREVFLQCWRDLATLCKDRRQEIWFDLYNEPLDWRDFPSYPKKWPEWAQAAVDVVRAIDAQHAIVVEPGPGGLCWGLKTFPLLKGANIIYSIHNYQPHPYTHQGIGQIQNTDLKQAFLDRNLPWPGTYENTRWDKDRIAKEFEPVLAFQRKHGVRIYVGEFGVIRWAPNAEAYLKENIEIFEKNGWDWTCHAFREWHGWSPEHNETFSNDEKATRVQGLTERGRVLLEALKANK